MKKIIINPIQSLSICPAIMILFGVLSTIFVTDISLLQGDITAKYFWFAAAMFIVSLLIPFQLSGKTKLHVTDVLFGALFIYICINFLYLNSTPGMHWWLTWLMFPLYVAVRVAAGDEKMRRRALVAILAVVLIEAIWGLLQLYGFARSHHNLYKITGSLFNPGPYAGFLAVGVPLALGYAWDKALTRWERWLGMITLAAALLALPATMSRTGFCRKCTCFVSCFGFR